MRTALYLSSLVPYNSVRPQLADPEIDWLPGRTWFRGPVATWYLTRLVVVAGAHQVELAEIGK